MKSQNTLQYTIRQPIQPTQQAHNITIIPQITQQQQAYHQYNTLQKHSIQAIPTNQIQNTSQKQVPEQDDINILENE